MTIPRPSAGPARADLPVVVIGAGPIGLTAAAHLLSRGETPLVLEAGDRVGASIRRWAHVRLFSPWKYLVDPLVREMLESTGWRMPAPETLPTGGELVSRLLQPLATHPRLAPRIRRNTRVVAVTRQGYDKVKSHGREEAPFELVVHTSTGAEERLLARAVIDASGTYETPNPLGASGLPVEGEREHRERIHYGIPDVLGEARSRYAGRRTLVIGSGHSAFNALLDLATLARIEVGTEVLWAIRRPEVGQMFGGGERDALPARGSLGERLRRLLDDGEIDLTTGFRATRVSGVPGGVLVEGEDSSIGPVQEVIVATGFRPDLELTRELRLSLDPWLEAPVQLAPLIDPNVHSCRTVYPHGAAELAHPEIDFYVVGMKSYGRAPTFLLLTGYEQVRSVVCKLVGDEEGARDVRLVLPETGVCSTDVGGSACCSTSEDAAPVAIGGSCGIASACSSPAALATATSSGGGCCG